jgi:hypothetical protein
MTPQLSENVTLNGDGNRWRLTINKPTKVLAGVLLALAGAFGGITLQPYLLTAKPPAPDTVPGGVVNMDSQRVDVLSLLLQMKETLATLSERVVRIESNTAYKARDVERLSRNQAEAAKEIDNLQRREVILERSNP